MTLLQNELLRTTDGLSDDSIQLVIDFISKYIVPFETRKDATLHTANTITRKLGSRKGYKFVADGHDIDDYNDEIEELFGVRTQ